MPDNVRLMIGLPKFDAVIQTAPPWVALLRSVARTFALSVKALPDGMRWPVALGYLLARASDTIADSMQDDPQARATTALRQTALNELQLAIQTMASDTRADSPRLSAVQQCLSGVPSPDERRLLQTLPAWLQGLSQLPGPDRHRIASVCGTIISGQGLDLLRFDPAAGPMRALANRDELDDYTWRVAGCVGQFWTDLAEAHVPNWRSADFSFMQAAARRYGMGLQGLNLLRDTAADLARGRCYWPSDSLAAVGLNAPRLAQAVAQRDVAALAQMAPCMSQWLDIIRHDLSQGLAYSLSVRPWRLRLASVLPALIGLRTVQALNAGGPMALAQPVKVPRSWVRGLLLRLVLGGLSAARLRELGQSLGASAGLDRAGRADGTIAP